jgi:CRISPR-associated protein Cas2
MPDKTLHLVVYDIPDDRRRTKLHDRLLDYGSPVQYSVFECLVDADGLKKMQRAILKTISKRRDHVRIYRLCGACAGKVWVQRPGAEEGKEVLDEPAAVVV